MIGNRYREETSRVRKKYLAPHLLPIECVSNARANVAGNRKKGVTEIVFLIVMVLVTLSSALCGTPSHKDIAHGAVHVRPSWIPTAHLSHLPLQLHLRTTLTRRNHVHFGTLTPFVLHSGMRSILETHVRTRFFTLHTPAAAADAGSLEHCGTLEGSMGIEASRRRVGGSETFSVGTRKGKMADKASDGSTLLATIHSISIQVRRVLECFLRAAVAAAAALLILLHAPRAAQCATPTHTPWWSSNTPTAQHIMTPEPAAAESATWPLYCSQHGVRSHTHSHTAVAVADEVTREAALEPTAANTPPTDTHTHTHMIASSRTAKDSNDVDFMRGGGAGGAGSNGAWSGRSCMVDRETARWRAVAAEAWQLVRREYINQDALDRGLEVGGDAASWLRPAPTPLKLTLRFFRWHLELHPFGTPHVTDTATTTSRTAAPPTKRADTGVGGGWGSSDVRSSHLRSSPSTATPPHAPPPEVREGCVTWDEVGRRLRARELGSQGECHEAIMDMMSLLPDRYSLFYRPLGLSRFVDGIDPQSRDSRDQTHATTRVGSVGLVLRHGWRAAVTWEEREELLPVTRIRFTEVHWVRRVLAGSAAARAGIREGDLLLDVTRHPHLKPGSAEARLLHLLQPPADAVEEEPRDKYGRGLPGFRRNGERERGGGEKSEKVEQLLQGPIAHKVSLHILCVREAGEGRRKEGGERGGARVCDTREAQLRFGGEMVGTGFREVLMQRIGRVGVVWEEGGGGRRGEEGERVVDLEMSEVPSEEAAWGKLMYMTLPHVAPETRPPLREQLQQLQHACSRIHDACLDPSSRILHTNGHGDKQGDGWLRGSRGSRGTGETHDQAALAASGSSSASSSSAQGRRIGYIRVFDFNTRTVPEVVRVVEELEASAGGRVDGYVVDLRGNMGGLLTAAIHLSDLLLPPGSLITSLQAADGVEVKHIARRRATLLPLCRPLAVVIDGMTASSSELLAAALADHQRAILVGERSFGKGSIQAIVRLSDGSGVQLTIGTFRSLHNSIVSGRGIPPHVHISGLGADEECVSAVEQAMRANPIHTLETDPFRGSGEARERAEPDFRERAEADFREHTFLF